MHHILEVRHGESLVARVRAARSFWSRGRGLLGRRSLPAEEGILIEPCNSVHTTFMRFPIDVVYLDREWTVVKIVPSLPAWRLSAGGRRAHSTLELAAGRAAAIGLQPGDRVEVR